MAKALPKIQTHQSFKITLFVRTKHNMQICSHPLYQAANWHLNNNGAEQKMRWRANPLIFFGVSYVRCLNGKGTVHYMNARVVDNGERWVNAWESQCMYGVCCTINWVWNLCCWVPLWWKPRFYFPLSSEVVCMGGLRLYITWELLRGSTHKMN